MDDECHSAPLSCLSCCTTPHERFLLDRQLYHADMSNFVLEIFKSVRQLTAEAAAAAAEKPSTVVCLTGTGTGTGAPPAPAAPAEASTTAVDAATASTGTTAAGPSFPGRAPAAAAAAERDGPSRSHGALVVGFLEWGVRYLLDNLARALDNDAFAPLVEQLQVKRSEG